MKQDISITSYLLDKPLSNQLFTSYLQYLSLEEKNRVLRFHKWQDSQASLMGKILLLTELTKAGYSKNILKKISRDRFNKPHISNAPCFNISHSGNWVVCAVGWEETAIGIDIEEVKQIEIENFDNLFTSNEWKFIKTSTSPLEKFYSLWCAKEAVSKKYGKGLLSSFNKITIDGDFAMFNEELNHLTFMNKIPGYKLAVASEHPIKLSYSTLSAGFSNIPNPSS